MNKQVQTGLAFSLLPLEQISNCSSETKGAISYLDQPQLPVAIART